MSALSDPVQDATRTVSGRPGPGVMLLDTSPSLWPTRFSLGTSSGGLADDALILTGGLYTLVSTRDTPVERISSIAGRTWAAIEAEYSSNAATTESSETPVAGVRRWTTGGFLAALMAGAMFGLPSPTPAIHAPGPDPFAPAGYLHTGGSSQITREAATTEAPEAYRAFKDLGVWLNAGDDQIADMLGVGRTTPYAWKREGREPRPETARRTYEYHAVMDSLRRRLEPSELQMWLREGNPSRRERLLAGELGSLDHDVHAVVFQPAAASRPDLGWAPEPASEAAVFDVSGPAPRRAARRPRRARPA